MLTVHGRRVYVFVCIISCVGLKIKNKTPIPNNNIHLTLYGGGLRQRVVGEDRVRERTTKKTKKNKNVINFETIFVWKKTLNYMIAAVAVRDGLYAIRYYPFVFIILHTHTPMYTYCIRV